MISTEQSKCEHDKCYAGYALCSNPPLYPWVCRKCFGTGNDRNNTKLCNFGDSIEYNFLYRKVLSDKY